MLALDTNTIIYFFKGVGNVAQYMQATPPNEIGIPSVVLYELLVGVERSQQAEIRRRGVAAMLAVVRILPFHEGAARAATEVRLTLERTGSAIGPLDTLIAGTALAHSAALVTHNTREFSRVPGLRLLDWY